MGQLCKLLFLLTLVVCFNNIFLYLSSELIASDQDNYKTVLDIKEVLQVAFMVKKIRNIALTGPYGSDKSSILRILLTILTKERKVLIHNM
ncbi:YobI family P-loop NTPase [Segatella cerevisiae]|uniref:YobI family P-loop NTPase n=1 Tax=Segatella cerevisiae TaxID=2053716 RepID=UPI00374D2BE1